MVIILEEAYTPIEFCAKRYKIIIKRAPSGRLKKVIEGESYGFLYSEALREAQNWAHLLNCDIIENQL